MLSDEHSAETPFGIEEVVSCNWSDGNLTAVLSSGERTRSLHCENVDYLLFLEEGVADRADLLVQDGHAQAFPDLEGLHVSDSSELLRRLKRGETFGEFVSSKARHYIVRAPYNCFEFISSSTPVVT